MVSEPNVSNISQLKADEHLIELYTLNNGSTPITIQETAFGKQNTAKRVSLMIF